MKSHKDRSLRRPLILMIDDMPENIQLLASLLSREGYNCSAALDGQSGLERIRDLRPELVLLDLIMPEMNGKQVLETLMCELPEIPVVVVTAETSPDVAAECLRLGASDYITKPIDPLRLCTVVGNVIRSHYFSTLTEKPALTALAPPQFADFVCGCESMSQLKQEAMLVATDQQASVLITGVAGTGKTLLGTLIADYREIDFRLDCSTLTDDTVIHAPVETAPLFLDNLGTLSKERQQRLLRRVRCGTGCVMTCGAEMENLLCSDDFWKELYFCSPCRHLHLPPIKERVEEVPVLFEALLGSACRKAGVAMPKLSLDATVTLKTLDFPGNVTELRALADSLAKENLEQITAADINQTVRF